MRKNYVAYFKPLRKEVAIKKKKKKEHYHALLSNNELIYPGRLIEHAFRLPCALQAERWVSSTWMFISVRFDM